MADLIAPPGVTWPWWRLEYLRRATGDREPIGMGAPDKKTAERWGWRALRQILTERLIRRGGYLTERWLREELDAWILEAVIENPADHESDE